MTMTTRGEERHGRDSGSGDLAPAALFLVGRDASHPAAAGGDLQAWQWATWLAAKDWDVTYIAQRAPRQSWTETIDGVRVLRLGRGAALALRARSVYRRDRDRWSLVYEDPIGAGRIPYLSPVYSRTPIIAVWHQVSADLLRSMRPGPRAALLALVERSIARLYRRCLFWAPSQERADEIAAEFRIARSRIQVIPPTLAAGLTVAEQPSSPARPLVVCVGVLRTYKNFEHVVEAMPAVLRAVPGTRLVIAGRIGSEAYLDVLRGTVERLGLAAAVEFQHDLSDADRQQLMRSASVLVLPSLLEGFGIVSIEANAEGTPVIASSGVPHAAVEDGVNGLRYEYGDVDALGERIARVLGDDQRRRQLSIGALQHARALTTAMVGPQFDALVLRATGFARARTRRPFADRARSRRRTRLLIVAGASTIAALWVAIFVSAFVTVPAAHDDGALQISSQPTDLVVGQIPVEAYIGSFTGTRAVLQFESDSPGAAAIYIDLARGRLLSAGAEIAPAASTARAPGGGETLTLIFDGQAPIGRSVFRAVVKGREFDLDCAWENR